MKLRHQNDSDENSHTSSTNELGESNKLVNGVKKSTNSIKNQTPPKTVGTIKVSSISEISTLSKKSSEVSRVHVQPELPADSVKSKPSPQKLNSTLLVTNNSAENSKADKNCKESGKSVEIDIDFEDTDDEEEDNVALKTLMENLDKGLNSNEDAKKSQAMIDDLMSDILEKDSKTEVQLCEKKDESSLAENQEESKNKAKKREAEKPLTSKSKCIKLDNEANAAEPAKDNSEPDIVVLCKDSNTTESSKDTSSFKLETVKCSKSDETIAEAIEIDSVNVKTKAKNENEKESAEDVDEVAKVVESIDVPNGISLNISGEDDDVLEIVVDNDSVNNKREAEVPVVSELPQKRSKRILSEAPDSGKSKLETYLTRPIAELNAGESVNETKISENKKNQPKEKIYKLTKAELETLIINKVTDYFSDAHKCDIGAIRKRCEHLEKMLEQWRKKAVFYQRKVTDFQIAVQRIQIKKQTTAKPSMRSVGLQVQLIKDPSKCMNSAVPTGGKHSVLIPTAGNVKNVLPKSSPNNQMAFFTSLGTHGALGTATIVTNSSKPNSQNVNVMKTSPIIQNGSGNVSILQAKLSTPTSINVSSAEPVPLPVRLVPNQAIRQANTTSSTMAATSITVSLVNQQPLLSNTGVKLIDLTGEEQEAAAAAAAGANGNKRIIPKSIATTQLPAGITMVPTISANSLAVMNASNASVNSGHVLTLSAGANIGVSTVANLNTVGVTTPAIRGPTTTPIINSQPVRLAYLMSTAGMTMVRQPGGQPVLMAPATHVRPNQPLMKPVIPTIVFRQGNTILPIQNGQIQNQIRPIHPVTPSTKVVVSSAALSTSTSTTAAIKPNIKPAGTSTSILLNSSPSVIKTPAVIPLKHPAPLPPNRVYQAEVPGRKQPPPKPALKISKVDTGIVLSWNMVLSPNHAQISSYQLYAYQENDSPPQTSLWKKVGDVRALPLPMACTLTQFNEGHKYYFAVRSVDTHNRTGPFSDPGSITLVKSALKKS